MPHASNEYLRSAILTAPPEQLQLMLYDGAIRYARQGIAGIEEADWEKAFNGFSRAQKIVLEMLNALNYDVDRELCTRMAGLYNFVYRRLVEASVQRDPKIGQDALDILEYQRETWMMLIKKLHEERAERQPDDGIAAPRETASDGASYGTFSLQG